MDFSEQIQVQGRTARFGSTGSYSLIIDAEEINETFGIDIEEIKNQYEKDKLYSFLHETRKEIEKTTFAKTAENFQSAKKMHEKTIN